MESVVDIPVDQSGTFGVPVEAGLHPIPGMLSGYSLYTAATLSETATISEQIRPPVPHRDRHMIASMIRRESATGAAPIS